MRLMAGALLLAVSVLPGTAAAQWLSAPGEGWVDAAFYVHDTRKTYDSQGERTPIFADGRALTTSLFVTASFGLVRGVDAWAQLPVHRLRFDDAGGRRVSTGFGDPRVFLRFGPELLRLPAVPIALRGGVKFPGGDFDIDPEIIPLGEGQRDLELMLEMGRSFYPRPFWTMGWVGRRWRDTNQETNKKPGDEWFWFWSAGGDAGAVTWQATLEGRRGEPWVIQGIRVPTRRESVVQALLMVGRSVGPGEVGVGLRLPLRGRNLPAGHAYTARYFIRLDRDRNRD